MIIQALVQYYQALASQERVPRTGWSKERVSYALSLSEQGELLQIVPLLDEKTRGKKSVSVPKQFWVPTHVVRPNKISPNFLCDNTGYLLGFDEKGKPARAIACFEACKALHLDMLRDVNTVAANAIKAYFQAWNPKEARAHPAVAPCVSALSTANLVFYVNNCRAHEDPEIVKAWNAGLSEECDEQIRCLVTGELAPFARIHDKVKLAGAQSSGANLVSFNAPSFESYGKDGGKNSPFGQYAAFAYVTALNFLLEDRSHSISLGTDTMVYWSQDASTEAQDAFCLFADPKPEEAHALSELMDRLEAGKHASDPLLAQPFYILCLSPNAARISVRFFLQDTFGNILRNCAAHYKRLEIERPSSDLWEYLSPYWLLQETVTKRSREIRPNPSPLLIGAVLNSILTNARYPHALYTGVFLRIHAEQAVTRGRAAIIKAYLLRNTNYSEKEGVTVSLNETTVNTAYVLGRLFAVLEQLQEQANKVTNATIKERYFTAASTTPAIVFPTLLRLSTHHLAKLDSYRTYMEMQIGQLLDKLTVNEDANVAFPKQLDLNEQGLFMLGYYHQVQNRYKKKEEK